MDKVLHMLKDAVEVSDQAGTNYIVLNKADIKELLDLISEKYIW